MHKLKIILSASVFTLSFPLLSQNSFSGKINNKKNEIIAGATVRLEGTYIASSSNSEGTFEIKNLNAGTYIARVSCVGYQTKTDTIKLSGDEVRNYVLEENTLLMDEVLVSATRANERSAMAFTSLNKEEIAENNLGQDLPYLLNQQPSVVTTSDAGAGVGYTGIRIRGVDATRVNVTINGIPVNDAESQGTYWVDLPDIASSVDNIQLQRGVGTSTNGAGAFGGSLNIETTKMNQKAYAEWNSSYGSFNTMKNTINAGSGLLNDKVAVDVRLSKVNSDGFIDRASSDLRSYYLSAGYYGKKNILKFITFSGYEETYQAWYGIPQSRLRNNLPGMNDYIFNNYLDSHEAGNLLNSNNRTYNPYTYHDQVDHYVQTYYQLHFSHEFNRNWNSNLALHYTKGKGYYEEYKKGQAFSSYGLPDIITGTEIITTTDLVRRRWLNNDFYGTTFSLNYDSHKKHSALLGGAWNHYTGLHYGEIIWAQYATNSNIHQPYYNDTANKSDFNIFVKANYLVTKKLNVFADLQYRMVNYSFLGFDDSLKNIGQSTSLSFFNPKIGIDYELNNSSGVYASYSIGNKEPSRDDYTQSTPTSRPKHETLNDLEAGFRYASKKTMLNINLYFMNYKNQLVLTGEVNDVGAYNRTNVASSYRQGIEMQAGIKLLKTLSWNANITLSRNKIKNFKEYIDNFDSTAQSLNVYSETDIAYSPEIIAGSTVTFEPVKNLKFSFISKYVGKQYLDNTSNDDRKLDAFFVNDLRVNYSIKTKYIPEIGFTLAIYNIFNEEYESNGYTWGYIYGGKHTVENFYFPQAGINYMAGLKLKF
jgi:iron complex outermembrane receptor protein